jgi:hypothetical protein
MSLLHQESVEVVDDAARGEELTKGTSHILIAAIVAAVLVSIAIAAYVFFGQKPPVATGEVLGVWVHPQHTETSGMDANGDPVPKQSYDQMMVFARVRLHNQSTHPVVLLSVLADVTMPDGVHSCYAASPLEYERLFQVYPQMPVPHGTALPTTETTLQPEQTLEGSFVSAFLMNRQQWDAHKDLSFSVMLQFQPRLVLTPHLPEQEQ